MIGSKLLHVGSILNYSPRESSDTYPGYLPTSSRRVRLSSIDNSNSTSQNYTSNTSNDNFYSSYLFTNNPAHSHSVPNIYKKSPYVLAKKPYSLEASVLLQDRLPLLRLARENENARAMAAATQYKNK